MEELKNQANELINGNINSYPALSREAAGKAILMLIEKAENLQEQLRLTQVDNNLLMTENACYREALELYADPFNHREKIETETSIPDFYGETDFGMFAREALKGGE